MTVDFHKYTSCWKRYNNYMMWWQHISTWYWLGSIIVGKLNYCSVNISERRLEGFFRKKNSCRRDFAVIVANLYGTKLLLSLFFVASLVNATNRIICTSENNKWLKSIFLSNSPKTTDCVAQLQWFDSSNK